MARLPRQNKRDKDDPFAKHKDALEANMRELEDKRRELQQALEEANEPIPDELRDTGPPVWRQEEDEDDLLPHSFDAPLSPREMRAKRIRDRNQFLILLAALTVVMGLLYWMLSGS